MKTILLFLIAGSGLAQTPASSLPAVFTAAGISYNSQGSPKAGGWLSLAIRLTANGGGTYSYSTTDFIPKGKLLQSSVRTGVAQVIRQWKHFTTLGLLDGGIASTGTNTGAAGTVGGVLVWQKPQNNWGVVGCMRKLVTTTGASQTVIEVGVGYTFGR